MQPHGVRRNLLSAHEFTESLQAVVGKVDDSDVFAARIDCAAVTRREGLEYGALPGLAQPYDGVHV